MPGFDLITMIALEASPALAFEQKCEVSGDFRGYHSVTVGY